jgi:hypothetical protein
MKLLRIRTAQKLICEFCPEIRVKIESVKMKTISLYLLHKLEGAATDFVHSKKLQSAQTACVSNFSQ